MEACCGAHHLARQLAAQGHEVRLMSPGYVRPYVEAMKNVSGGARPFFVMRTRSDSMPGSG
jgi:UDP:flavonoid glycosyltransferase YjiC (YdhE family)